MARSRRPLGLSSAGTAIKRSISSRLRYLGRLLHCRGGSRNSAGSAVTKPSLIKKEYKFRMVATWRATERADIPSSNSEFTYSWSCSREADVMGRESEDTNLL